MKIGIMQPYFFPYIGYFALIAAVDRFMVLDEVQFIRHGWIERNRILTPRGDDFCYISVPLEKHSRETLIKDIKIKNGVDWVNKIMAQMVHYKRRARYYNGIIEFLSDVLSFSTDNITDMNVHTLQKTCEYLGITTKIEKFSPQAHPIATPNAPDEWALNICRAIDGADHYINAPGGASFFDANKYKEAGIKLSFLQVELKEYRQFAAPFIPGLSILDVMMFNSPDEIRDMLGRYELIE